MEDGVKGIFKTLLRVPVIILVVYAVFNVFGFAFSYFRILGFSYVAMQTAVENNYIPDQEMNTLQAYLNSLETGILDNCSLECDTDVSSAEVNNTRVQYGTAIKVRVSAHYKFIWPLMPSEQTDTGVAAEGMKGTAGNQLSDAQLDAARQAYEDAPNNIVIEYTIPGLKYYPDLS